MNCMKKIFLLFFMFLSVFILVGCNQKKKVDNNIIGEYKLYEVKTDDKTMSAKKWKEITRLEMSLNVIDENKLTIIDNYINKNDETIESLDELYYDEEFIYKDEEKKKKYYSYEYNDGVLIISLLNDSHNSVYTYKKK